MKRKDKIIWSGFVTFILGIFTLIFSINFATNWYKESIKSTYFIVFILGIIETVLAFFGGPLVGIAVLIIALSLRSKLINAGEPVTNGVKLILIASGIHIASLLLWIFNFIMGFLAIAGIFVFFTSLLYLLIVFGVFITLIVACIFIYQEYSAIK